MSQFDYYDDYIQRVKDALEDTSSLGRLSAWLEKYTTLGRRPFSFKGHEYQVQICDSAHHDVVVIKPSQVGLTELIVRLTLAFLAAEEATVAMYLMPTLGEVQRAAKSRIDPVIDSSKRLKSLMKPGADGSGFKQIGTSQLITSGTFGKAVISVPTDLLVIDEYDFCNPENAATAESRLTHSRFISPDEVRGLKRRWSTPTAQGYGVDKLFSASNQMYRLVKCPHCGFWFWPNFLKNVRVKGWTAPMEEMAYHDAMNLDNQGLLPTARIYCEKCQKPLTRGDLAPERREWVAKYPERTSREGWQVSPFDIPDFHTPQSILRKLIDYTSNVGHFRNFVLGMAYSDASNSIVDERVIESTTGRLIPPEVAESLGLAGMVAGLDIGRTSWLVIGRPVWGTPKIEVVWVERIRLRDEMGGDLKDVVCERLRQYGVFRLVCDAMPYTDSVLEIQANRPEGFVLPNFYSLRDKKLPMFQVNDKDYSISSHRTKTLDYTAKKINSKQVIWPVCDEMVTVRAHLQGMKKVERKEEGGEDEIAEWMKGSDDHYFHAVNYLVIATQLEEILGSYFSPYPSIAQVIVGQDHIDDDQPIAR